MTKGSSFKKVDLKKLVTECRRCKGKTELLVRIKPPKGTKAYHYNLMTRCKNCNVNYMVDDSKFVLSSDDNQLKIV